MNQPKRISFWLVIAVMLVVIFIVFDIRAQQNHECQGGRNCNDGTVGTASDVIIGGDDSQFLALSNSLGDVEISGCVITKQFSIIVWARQSWEYDPWCLADKLDAKGQYEYAAKMRCTDKKTAKIYGDDCITVLNFKPPEPNPLKALVGQVPDTDDRYDELLERLDKYENEQQEANRSYTAQQQIQQQQYEQIQEIEAARQKRIKLIKQEFGRDEEATAANN